MEISADDRRAPTRPRSGDPFRGIQWHGQEGGRAGGAVHVAASVPAPRRPCARWSRRLASCGFDRSIDRQGGRGARGGDRNRRGRGEWMTDRAVSTRPRRHIRRCRSAGRVLTLFCHRPPPPPPARRPIDSQPARVACKIAPPAAARDHHRTAACAAIQARWMDGVVRGEEGWAGRCRLYRREARSLASS